MRRGALSTVAVGAVGFALVGTILFQPIWDSDAGWHLAVGRLILQAGIPRTNALAWTARDEPWYATSWLFDLVGEALYRRLGPLGFQLFVALFLVVALWAWADALRSADPMGPWLLPAGALALFPRITHRPHVATWAAVALVLALCLRGRGRGTSYRAGCALVVALFGNLHAGAAFAAGIAGFFCLEEFVRSRRAAEIAAAGACGLAILANPGALYNARYLLLHLHVQEVVELKEFLPATPAAEPLFFVALALALAGWLSAPRRAGFALPASFVVLAALGLRANRVAYDAIIVSLPLAALALGPMRERASARVVALGALLCAAIALVVQGVPRILTSHPLRSGWSEDVLAIRAAAFASREHLGERGFNALRDGGYLELAIPEQLAFADGRIQAYPPSFWRDFQVAERTSASFRAWLEKLGVEWAVTTRIRERLGGFRQLDDPGWALVYWDPVSEIWLRRDVRRFSALIARAEYRHFRPYGSIVGKVASTPRSDLAAFAAEVKRFDETAPGDPFSALVKCAIAARAALPDKDGICAAASADASLRDLAAKARALPPAE